MTTQTKPTERDELRLKDHPHPEDLEATKSPIARLIDWLR